MRLTNRYYRKIDKKLNILDNPNKRSDDPRYIPKLVMKHDHGGREDDGTAWTIIAELKGL